MDISKKMEDNNVKNGNEWIEFFKSMQFIIMLLIVPLWNAIDKYFEYQSKKDKEYIEGIVNKTINVPMQDIKEELKEIRKEQREMREEWNRELRQLLKDK